MISLTARRALAVLVSALGWSGSMFAVGVDILHSTFKCKFAETAIWKQATTEYKQQLWRGASHMSEQRRRFDDACVLAVPAEYAGASSGPTTVLSPPPEDKNASKEYSQQRMLPVRPVFLRVICTILCSTHVYTHRHVDTRSQHTCRHLISRHTRSQQTRNSPSQQTRRHSISTNTPSQGRLDLTRHADT